MKRSFEFFTFRRFYWTVLEYGFLSDGKNENTFLENAAFGNGNALLEQIIYDMDLSLLHMYFKPYQTSKNYDADKVFIF